MHFLYIPPQLLFVNEKGQFGLDAKALSGIRRYSRLWDGPTSLACPGSPRPANHVPGVEWFFDVDEEFNVLLDPNFPEAVISARPDIILALHRFHPCYESILDSGIPVAFTSEQDLRMRFDIQLLTERSFLGRARVAAGIVRREGALRRLARAAAGLQCNGFAAWNSYARYNENAILFHDHRMTTADLHSANDSLPWDGRRALRLGFSGRLIDIKGPRYFIELAGRLSCTDPAIRLHVIGTGELEHDLKASAGPNVVFHGFLDFESQWKEFVRNNIDIMVLPHMQGDPSCTYFEAMGCGVPILGFHNQMLTPLVRQHSIGWAVQQKDVAALVRVIEEILEEPNQWAIARDNALSFMRENDFDTVSRRRMVHLRNLVVNSS